MDCRDNSIVLNLCRSKTDQYKKGDNVIIAKKEQEELCPVRCVKAYLGLIAACISFSSSALLFRNVYLWKKSKSDQLK